MGAFARPIAIPLRLPSQRLIRNPSLRAGGGLPSPPSGYSYGYIKDGQQLNQLVYVTLSNGTSHPTIARTQ